MVRPLHLVLLGRGKTGSLVAEVASERGHKTTVLKTKENPEGAWLTQDNLRGVDAVIDKDRASALLAREGGCGHRLHGP